MLYHLQKYMDEPRRPEYMYFNNVETRPGVGIHVIGKNQEKWKGGWTLDNSGKLALSTGSKTNRLMKLFFHPEQPELEGLFRTLDLTMKH